MATKRHSGFALLMVMILLAVAVVLGLSYLSMASLETSISRNYQGISKARYVAESGLQHGLFLLRYTPSALTGSNVTPLGPYVLDGSDSYTISMTPDGTIATRFYLTAQATVGNVKRKCTATVDRWPGPIHNISYTTMVNSGLIWLPAGLSVNGDFRTNGSLLNYAQINGNALAHSGLSDPYGRITGYTDSLAPSLSWPTIRKGDYENGYSLSGMNYTSTLSQVVNLTLDNRVNNGAAITSTNIAGVVHFTPTGSTLYINHDVVFKGTIVADGDVYLDGDNITITPVTGFPAIITPGSLYVTNNAHKVVINGVVAASQGIRPSGTSTGDESITINGALICDSRGVASSQGGHHSFNFDKLRVKLHDMTVLPANRVPNVTVIIWGE